MQRASVEEFVRDPIDRWTSSAGFAYGCAAGDLYFSLIGERPAHDDLVLLQQVYPIELARTVPHASLFDGSRITTITPEVFDTLRAYIARHRAQLDRVIARQALVRPEHLPGATIAGFYDLIPTGYPKRIFSRLDEALAWLGQADKAPALASVTAAWRVQVATRDAVRRALREHLSELTLETCAERLGLSTRSLQRRLGDEGTSFRRERVAIQIERAMELLLDDWKVEAIAAAVDCASAATFCEMFRREVGVSPGAWREAELQRREALQALADPRVAPAPRRDSPGGDHDA